MILTSLVMLTVTYLVNRKLKTNNPKAQSRVQKMTWVIKRIKKKKKKKNLLLNLYPISLKLIRMPRVGVRGRRKYTNYLQYMCSTNQAFCF